MKKIVIAYLVVCLTICGLPFSGLSAELDSNVFYIENNEVIVNYVGDRLSTDKIEFIAYSALNANEGNGIATAGEYPLMCRLFGHDVEPVYTTTVNHYYYSTSPYCREVVYYMEPCVRDNCDYCVIVNESVDRIDTCHG